eukprot:COSAG02_NODE_10529_length_1921_cov_2.160263_1_plen_145_part_00
MCVCIFGTVSCPADTRFVRCTFANQAGTACYDLFIAAVTVPIRLAPLLLICTADVGLQHGVIKDSVPEAVPLNETLWPEYMRAVGYKTHAVGKVFHPPQVAVFLCLNLPRVWSPRTNTKLDFADIHAVASGLPYEEVHTRIARI